MYLVKTKYSLETNIEPKALLEKANETNNRNLFIIDEGPYAWLEIERLNKDFNLNIIYSICKERNGVKLIWIPKGEILKNIAKLENAYRKNEFSEIMPSDFSVLLEPSTVTKKDVLQKDIDTLLWLKNKFERVYILNKKEAAHNIKILKGKTGIHPINLKEASYLEPNDRDVSLMRKAIKTGKFKEDDYRGFIFPNKFLREELGHHEYNRTQSFIEGIKQEFIVEGHPRFKEKKMEYWNKEEIKNTTIPEDWKKFFNRKVKIPKSEWEQKKLALLCYKAGLGFNKKYGKEDPRREAALKRLKSELATIAEKRFYNYFLMVEDFIQYCKRKGVRVGKGRGSVVGSVLAFSLGIIEIDPVQYELKFERFINPFRSNKPDIDIDLPYSQIHILTQYVKEKYGEEFVAKLLTFTTFGVINAIQSIKNVFGIKEKIETWFPKGLNDLDSFLNSEEGKPVKNKLIDNNYFYIMDYVNGISELPQSLSVHPAGVVISQELNEIPLIERDEELVVPFTKQDDQIERLGCMKFDFLTVRTLDVIKEAEDIRRNLGKKLLPLDFNDSKTYELYRSGNTFGVFQMKSKGMRDTCINVQPERLEDLMDILSLYRPGPKDEIPNYVQNKMKGHWSFDKMDQNSQEFQDIVPILNKTHGIIVYQEQVMEIASIWAGYELGEADLLRRAISEKKSALMEKERTKFIERSLLNGREKGVTVYIYSLIEKFAQYGFNRSHAGGYAVFSFETCFQKAHYPVEYMTASLNNALADRKKLKAYLSETSRMGIEILKPDIFESEPCFTATNDGKIRMGLAAINGIGLTQAKKIKAIVKLHKKISFDEIKNLLSQSKMTGRTMDILIRAGVFDHFGDRYDLWQSVKYKKNQNEGKSIEPALLYIDWEQQLLQHTFSDLSKLTEALQENEFMIEKITEIKDKNGRLMAFIQVQGKYEKKDLIAYYNIWSNLKNKLSTGIIIEPSLKNERVISYAKVKDKS
ncbi:DNA polymerase III subunit alpha [Bacillus toyonensis]|uniref:DNA polymerase III subunit alpha n=1 Tax=Bacillus toyonensis TaxID=155322 RepID=UPI002E1E2921|nr:DNA polymerase III subunit alpha [Bacillus toyonensis]MED2737561.1 DNA polymerase III subunit alpha [Bacillus toyonensis]